MAPRLRGSLTSWSLLALGLGLVLGVIGHATGHGAFPRLPAAVRPLGDLWVAALQAVVLPLVIAHMLGAITGIRNSTAVGKLGLQAGGLFAVLLAVAGLFTLALAPMFIGLYKVDAEMVETLRATTTIPEDLRDAAAAGGGGLGDWLANVIPRNLVQAALRGDILSLLFFALLLGLAVNRLPDEQRVPLASAFQALATAMLTVVRWILWLTPVGVFAFIFAQALATGGAAAGMLGVFVVIQSGMMLLFTGALYPVNVFFGRVRLRDFARAVAPAQLVAVSTRSSIASLPALIEGGRDHLRLPATATGFVLPLSVSVFKINRTISSTVKLLFMAHLYGIPLGIGTLVAFIATVMLLSISSVGVPGGGSSFKTLPAYLAAGVPIEAVIILEAVDTIPDIFKTLLNVTGDMTVATLLSRPERGLRDVVGDGVVAGAPAGARLPSEIA